MPRKASSPLSWPRPTPPNVSMCTALRAYIFAITAVRKARGSRHLCAWGWFRVGGGTGNNALRAFDALPVWGPSRGGEAIHGNDMREIGPCQLPEHRAGTSMIVSGGHD